MLVNHSTNHTLHSYRGLAPYWSVQGDCDMSQYVGPENWKTLFYCLPGRPNVSCCQPYIPTLFRVECPLVYIPLYNIYLTIVLSLCQCTKSIYIKYYCRIRIQLRYMRQHNLFKEYINILDGLSKRGKATVNILYICLAYQSNLFSLKYIYPQSIINISFTTTKI